MRPLKGKAAYKVPNGKLLRVSLDFEGGKIKAIKITGDFFMHPETGVELIESTLAGQEIDEGIVASMPQLIAGKSLTDKKSYLWKDWFTALSEENIGIDRKGTFVKGLWSRSYQNSHGSGTR